MRAQLKAAEQLKSLEQIVREAVAVRAECHDLQRIERQKMNAPAAIARACKQAGIDAARLTELARIFDNLPKSQEYAAVPFFVDKVKERALAAHGDLCPPAANLCARDLYTELLGACLNTKTSPLEWVALAWQHATQEQPEVFAQGCTDPAKHEAHIVELREREQELLSTASRATTMNDLLFNFLSPGNASVTYTLSNGQVGASGPGDPRGPGSLAAWMEAQQTE